MTHHRAVGVQDDVDLVAVAVQFLVDRVVDDLPQTVHEATGVRGADVHAWPLAYRLQALKDLQVPRQVGALGRAARAVEGGFGGHG